MQLLRDSLSAVRWLAAPPCPLFPALLTAARPSLTHRHSILTSLFLYSILLNGLVWMGVLAYVFHQKRRVELGSLSGDTTLLPLYVWFLQVCAVVIIIELIAFVADPFNEVLNNGSTTSTIHGIVWSVHQCLAFCAALMLLSPGIGQKTMRRAGTISIVLSVFVGLPLRIMYLRDPRSWLGFTLGAAVEGGFMCFYLIIALSPERLIFRRPAVQNYLYYVGSTHALHVAAGTLRYFGYTEGYCVFLFADFMSILRPIVMTRMLYIDSLYWQGKWFAEADDGRGIRKDTDSTTILSPLTDTLLPPESAVALANAVDGIDTGRVALLNHAHLRIRTQIVTDPGLTRMGRAVKGKRREVVLGAGSNARVYKGRFRDTECAIKMIFTPELTPSVIESLCEEAGMLGSLQHANVVRIFGVAVRPPSVCLVMELCPRGSIYELLHKSDAKRLPRWLVVKLCIDSSNAVAFLHSRTPQVLHLDIKPSNLLLDNNFSVKLADLELARRICGTIPGALQDSLETGQPGGSGIDEKVPLRRSPRMNSPPMRTNWVIPDTPNWTAPELLDGRLRDVLPTPAADVYSLTMVIYEIFSQIVPYTGYDEAKHGIPLTEAICTGKYRPPMPEGVPEKLQALIRRGWASDLKSRPAASDFFDQMLATRTQDSKEDRG